MEQLVLKERGNPHRWAHYVLKSGGGFRKAEKGEKLAGGQMIKTVWTVIIDYILHIIYIIYNYNINYILYIIIIYIIVLI